MMHELPTELKYSKTHEWIRKENDGAYTIGITEHAQHLLGDMVFVELPNVDTSVSEGEEIGVLESVKAASDLVSPMSGEVIEVNQQLEDNPALLNADPYGEGWLIKIKSDDALHFDGLLNADEYGQHVSEDE